MSSQENRGLGGGRRPADTGRRGEDEVPVRPRGSCQGPFEGIVPQDAAIRMEQEHERIRREGQSLSSLRPRPFVSHPTAGYIVALRHRPEVTGPLSAFTLRLAQAAPCIRYDAANAHTTLAVCGEAPLSQFRPDGDVLARLRRAVAGIDPEVRWGVAIDFGEWALTADAVLVLGRPTTDLFWQAAEQLRDAGAREGLGLRAPWGAHMTAARFTEAGEGAVVHRVRELLMQGPALGRSRPAVEVGWYECGGDGFRLHAAAGGDSAGAPERY